MISRILLFAASSQEAKRVVRSLLVVERTVMSLPRVSV